MRWPRFLVAQELDTMFKLLPQLSSVAPVTVSAFGQHKTQVSDLPPGEQAKVEAVADRIIAGYRPARLPIVGVLLVGHADQDLARGAKFEQDISVERAQRVLEGLKRAIQRRAGSALVSLLVKEVAMRAVGVGARQRVFGHAQDEAQRAANRRVVIFLAEALIPSPPELLGPLPPQKHEGPGAPNLQRSSAVSNSFVPFTRLNITAPLAGSPLFVEGPPRRPNIRHDHGFLDDGNGNIDPKKRQTPTDQDRARKEAWTALLALTMQFKPALKDGSAAYKHFLIDNNGTQLAIDYEGFVKDDSNGQSVLTSAVDDTRTGVLDVFDKKFPRPATSSRIDQLSVTSSHVIVGRATPDFRYPYPGSENWQKAIGGHALWLSADVTVDSNPATNIRTVAIVMTLHGDDQYNFNPGGTDVTSGTADAENGRFEITGLGTEFAQRGTASRKINFTVPNTKQADNRVVPADQKVAT